jgi:hypothetical protein
MDLILKQFFFLLIILHIHIKFDGACQIDLRTYLKHLICACLTLMLFLFMDCKKPFPFYWGSDDINRRLHQNQYVPICSPGICLSVR